MVTKAVVPPTDTQLVGASRFDGVHFVTVFDRHVAAVHTYLARRLGDAGGAAHLGDAFSAAYAARRHFRAWGDSARPWLLGVATGVVRREWRLEQRQLRGCADDAEVGADAIAEHLQHLAARDRDILILAAWEEQEPMAVAMALDLPDGAVTARLAGLAGDLACIASGSGEPLGPRPEAGIARLRALRPATEPLDVDRLASVRHELQVLTGQTNGRGAARSTVSIAAEHEQHRRWSVRPGAALSQRPRR
jgi:RNA polymerase sigma-70 factor (ECF subfamily)